MHNKFKKASESIIFQIGQTFSEDGGHTTAALGSY